MILKSITPQHFGPFNGDSTLELDPNVTVLTGPNDAGKSLALRAIEVLCTDRKINSHEVNRDRIGEFNGKWEDDPEIVCTAIFETTAVGLSKQGLPQGTQPGSAVTVVRMMPHLRGKVTNLKKGNSASNHNTNFINPPKILKLPLDTEVGQEINLGSLNEAESQLIRLGFGPEFSLDQHKNLPQVDRSFRVREAEGKLNARLQEILPSTMPHKFMLFEIAAQPELLGVGLIDQHQGFALLGSRGAGVRKILNVMGALLRLDPEEGHSIVLYDEPETSLHADAQHMLRRLLENIGSHPNVQVVYTTHSPAMINTLRPQSIRVLERKQVNRKAVSLFVNNAFSKNYGLVRSSLGVSPADSLLYAPITVIAEGPTEILCFPLILNKMAKSGIIDSAKLDLLLSQTHILDGEGSSFEYMCRLAKSQNASPVVFLDGDKLSDVGKLKEKHPEIPVITLEGGKEFEDLLPKSMYIQAAAEILNDDSGDITESAFLEWEQKASLRPSIMFSKRVERWLRDEFDKPLYKPRVMQKAIELTEIESIDIKPFKQLVEAMCNVSNTL